MNQSETPPTLTRGWRRSLRTEAWYRRRTSWTAIITVNGGGYQITLQRTVRIFEDALDVANDVLSEKTGDRA